jgi:hypothetical protein
MNKIFETSEEIVELARKKWSETGLEHIGINLKLISVPKAKFALKVNRANATTNFLTKNDLIITVYEQVLDRLSDEHKEILMEGALSNISYDTEKDKIVVDTDFAREIFRMRRKYQNYVDVAEESYIVIETIEEEEKQRKEAERLAKKEKKNNK